MRHSLLLLLLLLLLHARNGKHIRTDSGRNYFTLKRISETHLAALGIGLQIALISREHPRIFATTTLAGINHNIAFYEGYTRESARKNPDLLAIVYCERAEIDMA
jgi:hypothetical protein